MDGVEAEHHGHFVGGFRAVAGEHHQPSICPPRAVGAGSGASGRSGSRSRTAPAEAAVGLVSQADGRAVEHGTVVDGACPCRVPRRRRGGRRRGGCPRRAGAPRPGSSVTSTAWRVPDPAPERRRPGHEPGRAVRADPARPSAAGPPSAPCRCRPDHVEHPWAAGRQGAGLVQQQGVGPAEALQGAAVADDHAEREARDRPETIATGAASSSGDGWRPPGPRRPAPRNR